MLLFGNQKQLFTLVTKYVNEYLTLIFNLPHLHHQIISITKLTFKEVNQEIIQSVPLIHAHTFVIILLKKGNIDCMGCVTEQNGHPLKLQNCHSNVSQMIHCG